MRKVWFIATLFPLLTMAARAQETPLTPKAEVYGSYSYFRLGADNYRATNLNKGFDAAAVYNLNHWLGFVGDIGGHWGHTPITINPASGLTANLKTSVHSAMIGPRFTYRKNDKVTPFANIQVGGVSIYRGYTLPAPAPTTPTTPTPAPNTPTPAPTPGTPAPVAPPSSGTTPVYGGPTPVVGSTPVAGTGTSPFYTTSNGTVAYRHITDMVFAWSIGGGFDVKLSNRVAYRPIEAEYFMTRPWPTSNIPGNNLKLNNLRLSTGISFRFGAR